MCQHAMKYHAGGPRCHDFTRQRHVDIPSQIPTDRRDESLPVRLLGRSHAQLHLLARDGDALSEAHNNERTLGDRQGVSLSRRVSLGRMLSCDKWHDNADWTLGSRNNPCYLEPLPSNVVYKQVYSTVTKPTIHRGSYLFLA